MREGCIPVTPAMKSPVSQPRSGDQRQTIRAVDERRALLYRVIHPNIGNKLLT